MASDEFAGNYMETHRAIESVPDLVPGKLIAISRPADGIVELTTDNGVLLRIQLLEAGMLRFRFSPDGRLDDGFSYAVDPEFKPQTPACELIEFSDGIALRTSKLSVRILRQGLKTTISDARSGRILCQDDKGFHWQDNKRYGGEIVKMGKTCQGTEQFHGLGDKSCDLDLRGRKFELWGSDTYAYTTETDPLYKNIPFYLGTHRGGHYGIFFDNSFRTSFDFGASDPKLTTFSSEGGEMNYYFLHGETPLEVVRAYTRLTGVPDMPPLWALGYHQCKWSYYPESIVRGIADGFRSRRIPCDAIYLDIDYMDGYRCFTWDAERFPDPAKMIRDLEREGFKTVVIIDPGLKIDPEYPVWRDGLEKDVFCRRQDGDLCKGTVWPGLCHFPDFTRPDVRDWWAGQFKGLIAETGVRGVWNDMNEPAVFEDGTFSLDVRHDYDGHPCSHRKAHNVYGMQMARATRQGLKLFGAGRRPFSITRSAYAGTQRHACAWTGDNVATWEHLLIANHQCQRMAVSGMSFIGSDVGGFIETPTPELYLRWVQMAAFHPFFRTHSSGDHGDQEPWSFGDEVLDGVRAAIELRYRLLPAIYSAFRQYVAEATPVLRPLALACHQDPGTRGRSNEFLLGDHLLISPISREAGLMSDVYLPTGEWFSYHEDSVPQTGGREIQAACGLDRIPVYVRAGAVIPHWPLQQFVGEIPSPEPELHVWWKNGAETSFWYEDAGDGESWRDGDFRESTLEVCGSDRSLELRRCFTGSWKPGYATISLILHGMPDDFETATCEIDGKAAPFSRDPRGRLVVALPPDFKHLKASH